MSEAGREPAEIPKTPKNPAARRRRIAVVLASLLVTEGIIWLAFHWAPFVNRTFGVPALLVVTGVLVAFLLWKVPQWQVTHSDGASADNRFDRENEARKTLAQILGGILLLAGLYSSMQTLKIQTENLTLQAQGQITDRFTKAIEQLGAVDGQGKKKLEVRLGAIYALERIARDSPRDHWSIMEVLTAYVRENSPRNQKQSVTAQKGSEEKEIPGSPVTAVAADVQAVLTVLDRRNEEQDGRQHFLDLHDADLSGAKLFRASFVGADLSGVRFVGADLSAADLFMADLSGAYLNGASLSGAGLHRADFTGADLRGAHGLTQSQIELAIGDKETKLPANLHTPKKWLTE
jgi:hypothetical protein